MTKDEALKLALEAFGEIEWSNNSQWQSDRAKVAITAIKEALAQPEQAPFGYFQYSIQLDAWVQNRINNKGVAFYTTPPQRTWVGLTWSDVPDQWLGNVAFMEGGKWAEKTLKEKNT